jgi:hypothetical protein
MKDERIITDERIETTQNRIAAITSQMWYWLILIAVGYRVLILKQHLRDFWDIAAIFVIVSAFGFLARVRKGVFDHVFKQRSLGLAIVLTVLVVTLEFFKGHIHSAADVGRTLIFAAVGLGVVIETVYLLNRRWKRKEGIEEEKDENPNAGAQPSK